MRKVEKIEKGKFYHIYNRGINGSDIFIEDKNYEYFLKKWIEYISPVAETFSYCLLKNHFHALVKIKNGAVIVKNKKGVEYFAIADRQFSHFFNGYAQGINKVYHRTGSLFEHPFKRIPVENNKQLINLIAYIHFNPQKHAFVYDFKDYSESSYSVLLSEIQTFLLRDKVFDLFGGKEEFIQFHELYKIKKEDEILFED